MKFHRSYAVTLLAIALAACGGGGGGVSTVTVACPDDSKQTATTLDLAAAACPAPTLVSITPANNAVGISPETIAINGIVIATSSALTTPASSDITLQAGTTNVPVTVTLVGTKGFKVTPSAKLLYAQAYTFLANVKDTLGKNLSVSGTFTTASVSCVAPLVPDSSGASCIPSACTAPTVFTPGINVCVYPIGVKVVGANQLPQGCNTWKDQCWRDAVTNGTVKWVATPATMTGYNSRPVVFAYFRNTTTEWGVTGQWNNLPMYGDNGSLVGPDISGGISQEADWVYGTVKGIIIHYKPTGLCYELAWNSTDKSWDNNGTGSGTPVTCPQ